MVPRRFDNDEGLMALGVAWVLAVVYVLIMWATQTK